MKKTFLIITAIVIVIALVILAPFIIQMIKGSPKKEAATIDTSELLPMGIVNEDPRASYRLEGVEYDLWLDIGRALENGAVSEETFSKLFFDTKVLAWSRSGWQRGTVRYYASFSGLDQKEWLIAYSDDGTGVLSAENARIVLKARTVTDVPEWLSELKAE